MTAGNSGIEDSEKKHQPLVIVDQNSIRAAVVNEKPSGAKKESASALSDIWFFFICIAGVLIATVHFGDLPAIKHVCVKLLIYIYIFINYYNK